MKKGLPEMYHNSINKNINNIQKTFSTISKNNDRMYSTKKYNIFEIERKINEIFNSPNFVYKADVNIVTKKELLKKRVIGKMNNYLITIDNEQIPISEIEDIYI